MSAPGREQQTESTRHYWELNPCGSKHTMAAPGTHEFFAEIERRRYELEPFVPRFADFDGARGKRLLEIGVGLGTDFVRFVRAGAHATGIDLTQRSIELVRQRLELEGLTARLETANAEELPFDSDSFERVYSWGVLHHTPRPDAAVAEAIRVLKPGGSGCFMLYGRQSWVAYGLWMRYALLRGRPHRSLHDVIGTHMESAGTKAYSVAELRALFAPLRDLRIEHVGTAYDRRVAGPLARLTGRWLGWFIVIRGRL